MFSISRRLSKVTIIISIDRVPPPKKKNKWRNKTNFNDIVLFQYLLKIITGEI